MAAGAAALPMTRRLTLLPIPLLAAGLLVARPGDSAPAGKPYLVFILADDPGCGAGADSLRGTGPPPARAVPELMKEL